MASKYIEFGSILESKEEHGGGFYIKVNKEIKLEEGAVVYVDTPQDKVKQLLERGFIDEAEAEERISKIPEWKKYSLTTKLG